MKSKILIVDDSDPIRLLIKCFLGSHYEYQEATNGLEGLLRARQWKPDLILLDLEMPELDGIEFLKRLRADPQSDVAKLRAIMFTTAEREQESRGVGADDFIKKPIRPDALRDVVERHLASVGAQTSFTLHSHDRNGKTR